MVTLSSHEDNMNESEYVDNNCVDNHNEETLKKGDLYEIPSAEISLNCRAFEEKSRQVFLKRMSGADVLPNGWTDGPCKNNIQVQYGSVEGSNWYTMKTTCTMTITNRSDLVDLLANPKRIPKYDEMTQNVQVLQSLSAETTVRLVSCKGVMFTSPRDFCVATTVHPADPNDGSVLITTRSVDHPNGQQRRKFVRAISLISGFCITPLPNDPHAYEVTVLAHMNLGGFIPAAVIKYLGLSAPIKLLQRVRDLMEPDL